jgi:hypothetical protein
MRGEFHLQLRDAAGLKDEDFLAAKAQGRLDVLLAGLHLELDHKQRNKLNDSLTWCLLHHVIGRFPGGFPMDYSTVPLHHICLTTYGTDIVYDDPFYSWYGTIHNGAGSANNTSGGKGFNQTADPRIVDTPDDGKEEVWVRHRFLWLPSEGNSNNIRSIEMYGGEYYNFTAEDKWRNGRMLLRSPTTGLPIVVVKNINQVLTLEYTFSLVAV